MIFKYICIYMYIYCNYNLKGFLKIYHIYPIICIMRLVTRLCFLSVGLFCNPAERKPQRRVSMYAPKSLFRGIFFSDGKQLVVRILILWFFTCKITAVTHIR
jgi:hypothetical protein